MPNQNDEFLSEVQNFEPDQTLGEGRPRRRVSGTGVGDTPPELTAKIIDGIRREIGR